MEATMRHPEKLVRIFGLLALAAATIIFISACKAKETTEAGVVEKAAPADQITMPMVASVLGKAEADHSGAFDMTIGDNELWIVYHFYTPEIQDIDDDIGVDMAPKIKELYKTFKTLDRVVFVVHVSHPDSIPEWKPYCAFVMTRKVIKETNWTDLLDRDFFKVVQELRYAQ